MATLSEDVTVTCRAAPVQIEGRLTDGRWFYFRSRHQRASLGAAPRPEDHPDGDAIDAGMGKDVPGGSRVVRDLSHLGPSGASWLSLDDAFALLREMAAELPEPSTTEGTPTP